MSRVVRCSIPHALLIPSWPNSQAVAACKLAGFGFPVRSIDRQLRQMQCGESESIRIDLNLVSLSDFIPAGDYLTRPSGRPRAQPPRGAV